jgi:nitrogen regulatory protein P-II 1
LKKIEAIVRRENFPDIDNALKQAGINGLTFFDAEGRGRAKGREMVSGRGTRIYQTEYMERTKLEIIVTDSDAKKVVDIILAHAKTGNVGDGKIFVSTVEQGFDIASGMTGEASIVADEPQSYAVRAQN